MSAINEELRRLEERLLDPKVRGDAEAVASLLADDFVEFGSSGRSFDKAAIVEELKNETARPAVTLSGFAARELAPDVVLVTYRSTRLDGSGAVMGRAWRSSIWVRREGRWQIRFHQGT